MKDNAVSKLGEIIKQQKLKLINKEFQRKLFQKMIDGFKEALKSLKPCCLK